MSPPRLLRALALLLALCAWSGGSLPAAAHPADEILERDFVHVHADSIDIEIVISAGIVKLYKVWEDADTNHDGTVTAAEREQFGQLLAAGYNLTLDGTAVPLAYTPGSLTMAATRDVFAQQGADPSGATVTSAFHLPLDATLAHTVIFTVNHYNAYASGSDGVPRPPELVPDAASGVSVTAQGPTADYDLQLAIAPVGASVPGTVAPSAGAITTTAALPPARSPNTGRITWLTDMLRVPSRGVGYALLGMIVAVAIGALHALTPGHGKTMVAAYLIGGRGRVRDAVVLGSAVTLTHTGSVILLGVVTLLFTRFIVPDRMIPWLEVVSGLGILVLGGALLTRRLRAMPRGHRLATAPALAHASGTKRGGILTDPGADSGWHSHEDGTEHTHGFLGTHSHTYEVPASGARLSFRSLVLMGMSGGLVPCPDALAILLVAITVGRVLLGLAVILCFSIGLAAVLIALGVAIASTRILERGPLRQTGRSRWARWLPAASALIVVLIGVATVGGALTQIAAMR